MRVVLLLIQEKRKEATLPLVLSVRENVEMAADESRVPPPKSIASPVPMVKPSCADIDPATPIAPLKLTSAPKVYSAVKVCSAFSKGTFAERQPSGTVPEAKLLAFRLLIVLLAPLMVLFVRV